MFVGSLFLLLLSKGKSQSIDYNEKYCKQGNCTTYYDGCNYCGCDLMCIQMNCEENEEDYCVICSSNMIWDGECAPVASTTCNEVITGVYMLHIQECQQKCTCPDDKPYWNETHCVTKNDCYVNINTIDPTSLSTSVPTITPTITPTSRPTAQPTSSGPTMTPPISPPTTRPTMTPPISPPTSRPTVEPTASGPTMSPPISGPSYPPVIVDYFPSHSPTKSPTKRPTNRPTRPTRRPTRRPTIRYPTTVPSIL